MGPVLSGQGVPDRYRRFAGYYGATSTLSIIPPGTWKVVSNNLRAKDRDYANYEECRKGEVQNSPTPIVQDRRRGNAISSGIMRRSRDQSGGGLRASGRDRARNYLCNRTCNALSSATELGRWRRSSSARCSDPYL
jgi:hypothetical protein